MPTVPEMYAQAMRFSAGIDHALQALADYAQQYAQAEADYRKGKAEAWVRCPNDDPGVKAGER